MTNQAIDTMMNAPVAPSQAPKPWYLMTKEERRAQRSKEIKENNEKLKTQVRVGTYLANYWGCTMSRVDYFQVVAIKGNRLLLGKPAFIDDSGGWQGHSWITGPCDGSVTDTATIRHGKIVLDSKSSDSSWNTLKLTEPGYKTHVYCD